MILIHEREQLQYNIASQSRFELKDLDEGCFLTKKEIWKKQVSNYVKCVEMYDKNKNNLYSVIWGLCSDTMKTKLKAL